MLRLFSAGTSTTTPVAEVMSAPRPPPPATPSPGCGCAVTALGLRHLVVVDAQGVAGGWCRSPISCNHYGRPMLTRMGGLADLMERRLPELPPMPACKTLCAHAAPTQHLCGDLLGSSGTGHPDRTRHSRLMAHTAWATDHRATSP